MLEAGHRWSAAVVLRGEAAAVSMEEAVAAAAWRRGGEGAVWWRRGGDWRTARGASAWTAEQRRARLRKSRESRTRRRGGGLAAK